ncbi:MAG: DUF3386 family protein [Nitrospirae bacterium]|nr:MAG: DUF3386 family protein [Nitrospirota bacterium]
MEIYTRQETGTTVRDDPKARELLRRAFEKTARWQPDFKGFQANLTINDNGNTYTGTVTVKGPRDISVNVPDEHLRQWAQNQIGMIAIHRGPRSFEESDGKYALTVEEDIAHPLGVRLNIHGDGMESWYRIKDDRITQINRKMPHIAFTINVEESTVTPEHKYLTTRYTVYYFSPRDGSLTNVESFSDTHTRVQASDLPATRRIISYERAEIVTRLLTFSNHVLL